MSLVLRLAVLLSGLLLVAAAQAEQFLVEAELWLDGEQVGTPVLVVAAGEPAMISSETRGDQWRLEAEVERASDHPLAPGDSLWVHVRVHQKVDGQWEELADSILGVPEGQVATLSVVDGEAAASPEAAVVYLRIKTSRMRPAGD